MKLALAGDTMLGRGVAQELERNPAHRFVGHDVAEVVSEADLFVLNLECCVSERGAPWADPGKPFFFRAPPHALVQLAELGVDCVTLANNHILDFGVEGLVDTLDHLDSMGIVRVGAGRNVAEAREPRVIEAAGLRLAVVAVGDHPSAFAAGTTAPGMAFADLWHSGLPEWLRSTVADPPPAADAVLVSPHWGPNMTPGPVRHVRAAAAELVDAGASLVAGHSAHVFHGVASRVLYDLGDFVDDYRVDPVLRNDLGLLFLVELEPDGPRRLEAVPIRLDYCHTCLAEGEDADRIGRRFTEGCAQLGAEAHVHDGRLVVTLG